MSNYWGLIIDTDQYAGNFERELCAYCTGSIGDCFVGEKFIDDDDEITRLKINQLTKQIYNEGCYRPVNVFSNKEKTHNNSVIIYFHEQPSNIVINHIRYKADNFCEYARNINYWAKYNFKILGFRLIESKVQETITDL